MSKAAQLTGTTIEVMTLQALIYQGGGNNVAAIKTLTQALSLAAPEGYIRVFTDEGAPMAALLTSINEIQQSIPHLKKLAIPSEYLKALLAALGLQPHVQRPEAISLQEASRYSASELVSEREAQVLRLLASGLSNQELADKMMIAVSTVKWHIKNIYVKLGAHNRAQAIKQARNFGILLE